MERKSPGSYGKKKSEEEMERRKLRKKWEKYVGMGNMERIKLGKSWKT